MSDSESEHEIGEPVPVNVVAASNTSSNDRYQRRSRETKAKRHPARFPKALPEFIIGLTTEEGDLVLDPFAGSNTTGEVAQEMNRLYLAFELDEEYLRSSRFRFDELDPTTSGDGSAESAPSIEQATLFSGT